MIDEDTFRNRCFSELWTELLSKYRLLNQYKTTAKEKEVQIKTLYKYVEDEVEALNRKRSKRKTSFSWFCGIFSRGKDEDESSKLIVLGRMLEECKIKIDEINDLYNMMSEVHGEMANILDAIHKSVLPQLTDYVKEGNFIHLII